MGVGVLEVFRLLEGPFAETVVKEGRKLSQKDVLNLARKRNSRQAEGAALRG